MAFVDSCTSWDSCSFKCQLTAIRTISELYIVTEPSETLDGNKYVRTQNTFVWNFGNLICMQEYLPNCEGGGR